MHITEFAGNSVDLQHVAKLHDMMRIPRTNLKSPWIRIRREPSRRLDDKLARVSCFGDEATLETGAGFTKEQDPGRSSLFLVPAVL